ncbi:unnamed protein product, partial [Closterium sp. NIES-54]
VVGEAAVGYELPPFHRLSLPTSSDGGGVSEATAPPPSGAVRGVLHGPPAGPAHPHSARTPSFPICPQLPPSSFFRRRWCFCVACATPTWCSSWGTARSSSRHCWCTSSWPIHRWTTTCLTRQQALLVYELMANASLDDHLFDSKLPCLPVLVACLSSACEGLYAGGWVGGWVGYCTEKQQVLLVYELMAYASLDYHLFDAKLPCLSGAFIYLMKLRRLR